jgi:hypothetical protein
VWTLTLGSLLGVGLLVVLVTWRQAWGGVGSWLVDQSIATLALALPAALALLFAGASFAALRRAVP